MCFYVILSSTDLLLYTIIIIVYMYRHLNKTLITVLKRYGHVGSMHFAKTVAAELEISLNELEISLNELDISLNELDISLNELEISPNTD